MKRRSGFNGSDKVLEEYFIDLIYGRAYLCILRKRVCGRRSNGSLDENADPNGYEGKWILWMFMLMSALSMFTHKV